MKLKRDDISDRVIQMLTKYLSILHDMKKYEELVKSNIEYQFLIERYPLDHDLIDELVDLVVEILVSQSSEIVISSNRYPIDLVRSRFLKLGLISSSR